MASLLMLRAFVAAPDEATALAQQARLLQTLQAFVPSVRRPPERYWKEPEWVELTLQLAPATAATFDRLMALPPQGWIDGGDETDRSAVWNNVHGEQRHPGLLPELQWAELSLTLRPD
jgi:hypothetical protein